MNKNLFVGIVALGAISALAAIVARIKDPKGLDPSIEPMKKDTQYCDEGNRVGHGFKLLNRKSGDL